MGRGVGPGGGWLMYSRGIRFVIYVLIGFACASKAQTRSSKIRFDLSVRLSVCACRAHDVVHTTEGKKRYEPKEPT